MASITKDANGRKRIQFFDKNGDRKVIRLGKASMEQADAFKVRLLDLVQASITTGSIELDTAHWLNKLDPKSHAKLVKLGLAQPRVKVELRGIGLGAMIDAYIGTRTTVKPRTLHVWQMTRRDLVAHFGEDKDATKITPGDADDWFNGMLAKYASATAGRRAGVAKQFFRWGFRKEHLPRNAFDEIKARCAANKERTRFISREVAQKVLDACPDAQWRLIFALCRYAGLRCPSEVLALRWDDVDFANGRMTVHSPKTEHHEGKDKRLVPIFPELEPYLLKCYDPNDSGEYVITRCRDGNVNLRTQLERIIVKAGLEPWPKLFVNLRSTRQTELVEKFPVHVVCAWLGNSALIANKHYLQVTEEHFEQAILSGQKPFEKSGAESGAVNAAQAGNFRSQRKQTETDETQEAPDSLAISADCEELPKFAAETDYCENKPKTPSIRRVGLEPTTR